MKIQKRIQICMDDDTLLLIDKIAEKQKRSRSEVLRRLVRKFLTKKLDK